MSRFYFFVNGILTSTGDMSAWNREAERWVDAHTPYKADSYSYTVGPVGRFFKQGTLVQDAHRCLCESAAPGESLVLCGHSNGCDLICRILREYPDLLVEEIHLIAAATDASYDANGLNDAVARGQVGAIRLYCSEDDKALEFAKETGFINRIVQGLGYGTLGLDGPFDMTEAAKDVTVCYWHDGFDHSDYFAPANFADLMCAITGSVPD